MKKPFSINDLLAVSSSENIRENIAGENLIPSKLNFNSLKAFSGDDKNAVQAIIATFIVELPLFTIGTSEITPSLL